MKKCAKCGSEKADSFFHKNARSRDGLCSYCKVCAKQAVDEWKVKNPLRRAVAQSNHYQKHKQKYVERHKAYKLENPEKVRAHRQKYAKTHQLRMYGFNRETYTQKLLDQDNRCAMCGTKLGAEGKRPVVDHCHSTGKTRDILCSPCNTGLGHIEKPGFLDVAMKYLAKHSA